MKKYLMMLFVALAVGFQSCDNNDDLWNAIDDLKSRVQALETQVTALNGNVEALKTLYGGATISKVDNKAGVYTITLSNGETIVLTQGSDAKAIIPVMSINADGFWQVSYDNGKTFTSLGVKATATDGVTPKFRIEEATGFWQVSYDNGANYANVLNMAGKPVSAVGTATITDKFFEAVAVKDGKFEVTMLDGSKLSIPILSDFYCRFAPIPTDVQTFAAGATKRFAVEIKGVDNTIVTAPDGWTAMLTDIVADKAELVITAPAAGTRATADNSKDVSILATAGSYACIAKLQVASSGVAPVLPTVAVANSMTTLPTASALTFDVTLSANAESWHYICQKSSVAAPEVAAVLAGTLGIGTSATVTGLEASTAYTIYVVATAGELNSTLASVENTTIAAPVTVGDYYTKYQAGENIVIGDLTISLATYGAAKSVKPSALTKEVLSAGGVIFVDNSDPTDLAVTLDGTSINLGEKFVLIGQYATSDQPQITTPELRCKYDAAFKNVHLIAAAATNLLTTGNATLDPTLTIADCVIDATLNVIYDSNPDQSFVKIFAGNSVIKMTTTGKPFYAMTTAPKSVYPQQSIKVENNVFYAETPLQNFIVNAGDKNAAFTTTNLTIDVQHNTIYNIYQPNVMIRAKTVKGFTVSNNVGYYDGSVNKKSYLTAVYDLTFTTATVDGNYLYTTEVTATNFWSLKHTGGYTPSENKVGPSASENPFDAAQIKVAAGYFPINTTVVTNGAGASYTDKPWIKVQ